MGKRNNPVFGATTDEVNSAIGQMSSEREELAKKIGTKDFSRDDNRRFEELTNNLITANKQLASLSAPQVQQQQPFTEQKTTVLSDPNTQLTGQPGVANINPAPQTAESLLPQNQPFQAPQQNDINQSVLGSTQPKTDIGQEITTSVLGPRQQSQFKVGAPGVATTLTAEDVSRGINDPILKGTVSGQIIGNQPIFVGGANYAPFHVIARRQQELQAAANKRAEEEQAFLAAIKPPTVQDQRFQGDLNDRFNQTKESFYRQAQNQFGPDWVSALKDQSNPMGRQFVNAMDNYNFVAGNMDQVTEKIAQIDAGLMSGKEVYSDETLQLRDDYERLQNDFLNGDVASGVNLANSYKKLNGYVALDQILTDQDFNVKGKVDEIFHFINNDETIGTSSEKRTRYEDQIRILAAGLAKNQMRDAVRDGFITEDEIFQRINARYGPETTRGGSISQKREPDGGAKLKVEDIGTPFEGEKIENVGGVNLTVGQSFELPSSNRKLEASGLKAFDPKTQKWTYVEGVRPVDVNAIQIVRNPQTGKQEKVIIGTHEETIPGQFGGAGTKKQVTAIYAFDEGAEKRLTTDVLDEGSMQTIKSAQDVYMKTPVQATAEEQALKILQ